MISEIEKRIECRMTGELCDKAVMGEISQTVLDRICIRLGISNEKEFPALFFVQDPNGIQYAEDRHSCIGEHGEPHGGDSHET